MSLLAWYPLIANGNNQGLDGVNLTLRGSVPFTAGKLGNAANSYHKAGGYKLADKFSWTCWVKLTTTESTAQQFILSEGRDVGSIGVNLRCNQSGLIFLTSTAGTINIGTVTKDTWHHVAITVNSDDKIRTYLDGAESGTAIAFKELDYAQSDNVFVIGKMSYGYGGATTYFPFCGQVQDVRVYDHVLSKKEIKELSKGLVMHLPLDWSGNTNILPDNPVATNSTENNSELGRTVYVRSTTATSESYIWSGRSDVVEQSTKYTFSAWYWVNDYVKSVELFWLSTNTTNKKTGTAYDSVTNKASWTPTPNQWNYVTWTFTSKSDDYTGVIRWDNNGSKTEGTAAILKVCNMKLEKGETATPFIPHKNDSVYASKGFGTKYLQDCSGYNRTVTAIGSNNTSCKSPRGLGGTTCGASSCINLGITPKIQYPLTFAFWFNTTDLEYNNNRLISCTEGGGWNIEGKDSGISWTVGTGASSNTYKNCVSTKTRAQLIGAWHHIACTYDGLKGQMYIDGVLDKETTFYSTATPIYYHGSNAVFLCGESGSNASTPATTYAVLTSVCDFRMYATILSADDIKELYQIPVQIDKSGKIYCNQLVEV